AYEAALAYAQNRVVFGEAIIDFEPTRDDLQAERLVGPFEDRQHARVDEVATHRVLHGGMGYAEESPVSRYFVDARVLSIFEGADETLCLKVIARRLVEQAAA